MDNKVHENDTTNYNFTKIVPTRIHQVDICSDIIYNKLNLSTTIPIIF